MHYCTVRHALQIQHLRSFVPIRPLVPYLYDLYRIGAVSCIACCKIIRGYRVPIVREIRDTCKTSRIEVWIRKKHMDR